MTRIFDLSDKVAVITGGASGIGESIAKVFAGQGAVVCILDIDTESAKRVVDEINDDAHFFYCDMTDHDQVVQIFEQIYKKFDRMDILVNNAGIAHIGNVENTMPEDLDRIYRINIRGAYSCLHAGVKQLKKSGGGVILNLSSIAAVLGLQDRFAYSVSKGAVLTMTYSVARDFINDGIRCNAIGPARVHTPFIDGYLTRNYPGQESEMLDFLAKKQPIGRMGSPEEIAHLALYLCSDEASFVTGSYFPIDGGAIRLSS